MIVTDVCITHKVPPVHTVDEILASSPLSGLQRVSGGGGDRQVALVRLAERFADLDDAPPGSLVVLSRAASAEVTDYRLDMGLRWAAVNRVAAVAAFRAEQWRPTVTAMDIAGRADIALISIPAGAELAGLVQAIAREIGGGAQRALGRAEEGLNAVLHAEATSLRSLVHHRGFIDHQTSLEDVHRVQLDRADVQLQAARGQARPALLAPGDGLHRLRDQ